ncbi:sialate O-acetylesterase [Thalassotalea sp. PLHSN55]|uniref:sialate O-acetylesterase n=1 Tax=Thalassotalea sp. PLHSN55 TaxID=3435888 RepID=UPI003F84FDF4
MLKKSYLVAIVLWGMISTCNAQTSVPSFFQNGMVLQQNNETAFWGFDKAHKKVTIETSWGVKTSAITNNNGVWRVKLNTPSTDFKKHHIKVQGSSKLTVSDILLGEVWFASGQSNMAMRVEGSLNQPIIGSNDAILTSENDHVRMFYAELTSTPTEQNDIKGQWQSASQATTGSFSAVGYFFARKLQQVLKVPIGIVHSSWGGSPVEAWLPAEVLKSYKGYSYETVLAGEQPSPKRPSHLYNAMVHPYLGLTIRGILWYQGEANWKQPKEYQTLFPAMINSWRERWQQPELPFYFVQISPKSHREGNSAYLREAQLLTMKNVSNTGMAVILDIGECANIHPSQKQGVGERLSYWAFNQQYGYDKVQKSGPVYRSMSKTDNGRITLTFDHVPLGLSTFNKPLTGFEISGKDKQFYPAKAKIDYKKTTVTVWSDKVKSPEAARYAFENCPEASLFNTAGLPASSFRTDNW